MPLETSSCLLFFRSWTWDKFSATNFVFIKMLLQPTVRASYVHSNFNTFLYYFPQVHANYGCINTCQFASHYTENYRNSVNGATNKRRCPANVITWKCTYNLCMICLSYPLFLISTSHMTAANVCLPGNILWYLFHPVLLQKHAKDPGHSARSAGC